MAPPAPVEPASAPPQKTAEVAQPVHIEVDAPMVYRAEEAEASLLEEAIHLHVSSKPLPLVALSPPPLKPDNAVAKTGISGQRAKPKSGRFFGRVKAFFASIFR
jgi:hypothetical protein